MDQDIIFEKYLLGTYRFLNFRLRSEKEIRDYLQKKKVSADIIEKIIVRLQEQKFLNDETFARMWIESRSRSKPRSQFLLKRELQQKGISREIIEKIMTNDQLPMTNDYDLAKDVVQRKIKKYRGMERQEIYRKLGGLLARRGFNWDVTKKAIDEILAIEADSI